MEEKTVKCIKCQNDFPIQESVKTPKGVVCRSYLKKNRIKNVFIVGGILFAFIGGVIYYFQTSNNNAVNFDGITNIQDSVNVSVQKPAEIFDIAKTVAQASPVAGGETIDNIESFKRVIAENLQKAKDLNSGSIIIPNISILFSFNSFFISSTNNELLIEYAKTFLQTNKEAIILVEGFACNIGSDSANNWISEQRAKSVREELVVAGIPKNKIEVKWFGKSRFNEFKYSDKSEYRRVILSVK